MYGRVVLCVRPAALCRACVCCVVLCWPAACWLLNTAARHYLAGQANGCMRRRCGVLAPRRTACRLISRAEHRNSARTRRRAVVEHTAATHKSSLASDRAACTTPPHNARQTGCWPRRPRSNACATQCDKAASTFNRPHKPNPTQATLSCVPSALCTTPPRVLWSAVTLHSPRRYSSLLQPRAHSISRIVLGHPRPASPSSTTNSQPHPRRTHHRIAPLHCLVLHSAVTMPSTLASAGHPLSCTAISLPAVVCRSTAHRPAVLRPLASRRPSPPSSQSHRSAKPARPHAPHAQQSMHRVIARRTLAALTTGSPVR